ncbi:MAG TPA: hypothetical protein VH373_12930 [Jatrophihabitantaceae bacterium]
MGTADIAKTLADLAAVDIKPVASALDVDLGSLLTQLDPSSGFFGHDKVEGVSPPPTASRTTVSIWRSTPPSCRPSRAPRR